MKDPIPSTTQGNRRQGSGTKSLPVEVLESDDVGRPPECPVLSLVKVRPESHQRRGGSFRNTRNGSVPGLTSRRVYTGDGRKRYGVQRIQRDSYVVHGPNTESGRPSSKIPLFPLMERETTCTIYLKSLCRSRERSL